MRYLQLTHVHYLVAIEDRLVEALIVTNINVINPIVVVRLLVVVNIVLLIKQNQLIRRLQLIKRQQLVRLQKVSRLRKNINMIPMMSMNMMILMILQMNGQKNSVMEILMMDMMMPVITGKMSIVRIMEKIGKGK